MANPVLPRGAKLVGHTSGSPLNARIRQYTATTAANAVFPGDFVTLNAAGTVDVAVAGGLLLGVCVGVVPNYADLTQKHKASGVAGTLLVCDDPESEYEIQSAGTVATTDVGLNADIVATAGSTVTGNSRHALSGTMATATAQCRIVALVDRKDNETTGANQSVVVRINEHTFTQFVGV